MLDQAREIERAKQLAIDELNSHANEMGEVTYDILLQTVEDTFDTKAGKIVYDKDFVKKLNGLTIDVLNLIQNTPKFTGPVSKFIKRLPDISDTISAFQKEVNEITVPAFESEKNIVIDETISQLLDNGLNQNFVQPLRDLIYRNITSGSTLSQIKQQIKEYIQGGKDVSGKLSRYIDQTANQTADAYSGAINKKLLETFNYDALLITGSLIDTSSPQCRYAILELDGKIRREDWSKLVNHVGANQPMIPGTTFDNLPVNRLHWGCRHSFYPIILKK